MVVTTPEKKKSNSDIIEDPSRDLDVPENNIKKEKTLRRSVPKLTSEQFQQHLNADPKLKEAYLEHQSTIERQKKANERVKNTGYFGTLWGGITGDSGLDDLAKINEDTNAANTKFRNALDQNSGYSKELKQQLIGYKLGADSGVNAATAQAAGDASERANDYKNATIATAVGAGALATGGFVGGVALAAGGTALAAGEGTLLTLGGMAAGGALAADIGARGYSLARDGGGVMMGKKGPSVNEYIENQNQAGFQGRVLGAALPLAAVPAGAAVLAGVGSYFGAKSIQNSAENLSQAHQLSRQESAARKSGDTQYANTLEQQKNNYLREGVLSAGDTAAILGVGGMANGALKKVKGTQKLETGTSSTPKGSSASPEPSTTPRTNRDALGLGPKTRENTRRNSDRGADLPAAGTGFKKVESVPGKYLDLGGTQGSGKNVRRNPDKPVEGATLPEPRQIFKKVASKDASGNTTSMTREFHSEYDRANNKYLGRTQIDKSITRDAQGKKVKWDSTTYGPRDYTNSPTQIRQDRRKFDANGNMIQGENRTLLSDGSQRIFKMTPDGFQSTHISANGDVKQRHRNRVNPAATPAATPQLPDNLKTVTKPQLPPDIRTIISSKNNGTIKDPTSGNTTSMTREFHSVFDRANNKNLGRTQIDKSITHDAQRKMVKRDSTTYGPRDYTNSPTQIRQDRRKFDANGNMIQGENRTLLSDGSQRIFKMTPDGFQSTHISANGDVKQRHRNRVNPAATPAATPQLPDHLQKVTTPPAKVEAPKSKPVPTNEEIEATRLLKKKSSTPSRTL